MKLKHLKNSEQQFSYILPWFYHTFCELFYYKICNEKITKFWFSFTQLFSSRKKKKQGKLKCIWSKRNTLRSYECLHTNDSFFKLWMILLASRKYHDFLILNMLSSCFWFALYIFYVKHSRLSGSLEGIEEKVHDNRRNHGITR